MPLSLIAGPANAGKVELLLDRYLAALEREPVLIVPNRSDVDRVERELLARRPALLGGSIGTFDDLFKRIASAAGDARPLVSDAQRALLVRRALAGARLNGLSASARFGGFADALLQTVGELESGLLDPDNLDGDLAELHAAYRSELDRLGLWDRYIRRRRAAERLQSDLEAWHGEPVFAYGFEDLTGAEWALLEALAARTEVSVSLPYEPGRPAFASLRRTADDLARLAAGRIEELPPRSGETAHAAIAHLERALFSDEPPPPVPLDGAIRFFEGAGARGALELVGEELLALLRAGTRAGVDRDHLSEHRAPPRAARDGTRHARRSVLDRRRGAARADAARSCAHARCSASRGSAERAAICSRTSARRSRGWSGARSTSSKAACAVARCRRRSASSRNRRSCAAHRCPRSRSCRAPTIRSRRCARSRRGCCVARTDSTVPPRRNPPGSTCARTRR